APVFIQSFEAGNLRWLRDAVQESIDDPAKKRWRGENSELLDAIVAEPGLKRLTPTTITDVDALKAQLAETCETRLSWNNGESHSDVGGVAAPVLDEGGGIVAAIAAVFPNNVAGDAEKATFAAETLKISERISEMFRAAPPRRSGA
ncbi:MAG: IclR family transcriptional regulator C-terminal domain-containing protein, partial [Rhodospirillaceae bacterium]